MTNGSTVLAQTRRKECGGSPLKGDDLVVRGEEQVLEAPELIELYAKQESVSRAHQLGKYVDPQGSFKSLRTASACLRGYHSRDAAAGETAQQRDRQCSGQRLPGGAPNVQDIYPLAPLQGRHAGFIISSRRRRYGNLSSFFVCLRPPAPRLDKGFCKPCKAVINDHEHLRHGVLWKGLPEPVPGSMAPGRAAGQVEELASGHGRRCREEFCPPGSIRGAIGLSSIITPRRPLMRVYIAS